MVNVIKGVLVECDPVMKQFLLHLDETQTLGRRFVLVDLDDTHLFVDHEIVDVLRDKIDELMDENTFSVVS